jgi:hypothetical protein
MKKFLEKKYHISKTISGIYVNSEKVEINEKKTS